MASYAMGMDTMMRFYSGFRNVTDKVMEQEFMAQTDWKTSLSSPYFVKGTEKWIRKFESETITGITVTAPGFYGPQGRSIRLELEDDALIEQIAGIQS